MLRKLLTKRLIISLVVGGLITVLVPQFITYDTGVRCVTAPCEGVEAVASLLGWFLKERPLIIDADYAIPVIGFFLYSGLVYWLYPKAIKLFD